MRQPLIKDHHGMPKEYDSDAHIVIYNISNGPAEDINGRRVILEYTEHDVECFDLIWFRSSPSVTVLPATDGRVVRGSTTQNAKEVLEMLSADGTHYNMRLIPKRVLVHLRRTFQAGETLRQINPDIFKAVTDLIFARIGLQLNPMELIPYIAEAVKAKKLGS